MSMRRSFLRAATIAVVLLVVVPVSVAWAHECYNASASDRGNLQKALNSNGNWELIGDINALVTTGDAGGIGIFPTAPPLTPCQQAAFWAVWDASGLPHVFTGGGGNNMANGQGNVIAENNPNMDTKLGGNNRGIDHAGVTADTIFNTLFAAYGAAYAANCP